MAHALSAEQSALAVVSRALAVDDPAELQTALEEAWRVASAEKVEEVLLQAYLFLGFPPVLNALAVWRGVRGGEVESECGTGWDGSEGLTELDVWTRRGERLARRIYGGAYGKLRRNVQRLHPALDRWMVTEGYGKVLSRPGLDTACRELCIVSLLAAADRLPQLHSHLRGALNVGVPLEAVEAALSIGLSGVRNRARRAEAEALWRRVVERWDRRTKRDLS